MASSIDGGRLMSTSMLTGWPDPLVKQNVSMAFAWSANDTASRVFGKPTQHLSDQDSPLIFSYSLDTGLAAGTQPYNVRLSTEGNKTNPFLQCNMAALNKTRYLLKLTGRSWSFCVFAAGRYAP